MESFAFGQPVPPPPPSAILGQGRGDAEHGYRGCCVESTDDVNVVLSVSRPGTRQRQNGRTWHTQGTCHGFRRFSTRWRQKIHIAGRTWHTQGTSHDFAVSAHAGGTLRCEQGPRYYKKCRR